MAKLNEVFRMNESGEDGGNFTIQLTQAEVDVIHRALVLLDESGDEISTSNPDFKEFQDAYHSLEKKLPKESEMFHELDPNAA